VQKEVDRRKKANHGVIHGDSKAAGCFQKWHTSLWMASTFRIYSMGFFELAHPLLTPARQTAIKKKVQKQGGVCSHTKLTE
jgi:hypothetical protein